MNDVNLQSIPQDACPDVKDQVNQPTPPPSYDEVPAKQQELNSHPQIDPNLSGYGGNTTQGTAPRSMEPPCILYGTAGTYSQGHQVHPPTVQSLGGGYGWCTPMGPAPIQYQGPQNIMQPGPQYNQAGSYIQGQHNNVLMTQLMNLNQSMCPVGVMNGQPVYGLPAYFPTTFTSAAPPPPSPSNLKKRKREDKYDDRTYVKKPPNAFMLFMNEERPKYVATMRGIGTAGINMILGDKWRSLSKEEKEIYYEQAQREKVLHAQQHPEWSTSSNYGQRRRRDRRKAPKTEASTWISEEVTRPAQKKCVTPRYAGFSVESSHLIGVAHPHTVEMFEHLEKVESLPPPTTQTQQPISEIQTAELNHFASLDEWLTDLLKSHPPVTQTQQPISEIQTTESDPFAWLEEAMAISFVDTLESPFRSSMPQTQFSKSIDSPDALGDYESVESNNWDGVEHP